VSDSTIQAEGGRTVDPGFKRNMKIIGGFVVVVAVIVLFLVMTAGGSEKPSGGARVVSIDQGMSTGQAKGEIEQTPAMQAKLQQIQQAEAAEAKKEGRSYVPTESIGRLEPVEPPAPPPTPSTMQVAQNNMQTGGMSQEQLQSIREGLRTQLAMIVPTQVQSGAPRQSLSFRDERAAQSGPATTQPASPAATAGLSNQSAGPVIVPPLEIVAAKLANPITAIMGKPSYASAIIMAGPLKGAFLTGTSTLNENETIETTFTTMRLGNKGYKVDAIILDEQTADAGVKGDVDRRILQRYVLPVAVAAAQGYFTASAQTGSTVLAVSTGTAAIGQPPPTSEQARNAGIAAGLGIAGKEVQKSANEPIRSSVQRDMTIGILFRAAVKDEIK
jgi:hypothetical protein